MLYMLLHPAEMAHSAINELGEQHERKADEQAEQHAPAGTQEADEER